MRVSSTAARRTADDKRVYLSQVGARTHADRAAWAQLVACAWLIEKGFSVFRKVSASGSIDLVVERNGRFRGIDVKLTTVDFRDPRRPTVVKGGALTDEQESAGVIPLFVTHDGVCAFDQTRLQALYRAAAEQPEKSA